MLKICKNQSSFTSLIRWPEPTLIVMILLDIKRQLIGKLKGIDD